MTALPETPKELEIFLRQSRGVNRTVKVNLAGITHEESLIQPVLDQPTITRYARGADPITESAGASQFAELMRAWAETVKRIEAGLAGLTAEALDRPAPQGGGPSEPGDKVRDTLSVLMFHQGYHAGQTGVLRRLVGKAGAIK